MATQNDPAYVHAIAGSIGGCIATVVTYPLMAKSARAANARRRQAMAAKDRERDPNVGEKPGANSKPASDPGPSTSSSTSSKGAIQYPSSFSESIRSLRSISESYTGLSASLVGTTVSQGVYFYFYSLLRSFFLGRRQGDGNHAPSVVESLGIASLAGMANVLLTNPIWVVATRLQTLSNRDAHADKPSNLQVLKSVYVVPSCRRVVVSMRYHRIILLHTLTVIARTSIRRYADYGIPGFWNGCGASLIMVINPTIQYAIYEWLMARTMRSTRSTRSNDTKASRAPSTLHVFLCSSVAKAGATLCTYPMLTIKTRMMSARRDQQYRGVLDAVRSIHHREGFSGYFQGIETKILQSILGASVLLMIKEKITAATRHRLGL